MATRSVKRFIGRRHEYIGVGTVWVLIQIGIGGAIGAMSRYMVGLAVSRAFGGSPFPLGVLSVNIFGSFLLGLFVVFAAQRDLSHLSPFLVVGMLGGFTTFSAFSYETVELMERGQVGLAMTYVSLSIVCSIAALMFGQWLARGIFS